MRSNKKSAPAIAGTIRRSRGLGGNPFAYLTTRGSARSSIVAGGMTPVLRRAAQGALFAVLVGAASFHPFAEALADGTGEPETVFFSMAPSSEGQNAPAPSPRPWRPEVDQGDAEILAKLLWSSPLTNEDDKRKLCWIVFNRIDDETFGLFGSTVDTVVIRREFTFYDRKAHISETNLRIARDELARWAASLMGIPVERPLPAEYLYASFSGHTVQFYEQIGGNAWNGS